MVLWDKEEIWQYMATGQLLSEGKEKTQDDMTSMQNVGLASYEQED